MSAQQDISKVYRYDIRYNRVTLSTYTVKRKTTFGYWIKIPDRATLRFINVHTLKQFAYPTKEKAMVGFIARKDAQLRILTRKIDEIKRAKELVATGNFNNVELLSEFEGFI